MEMMDLQKSNSDLVPKKLSRPLLAVINEDYKKIRDLQNAQEADVLINYILTILNIKTSTPQEQSDLQVQMLVVSDFIKTKFGFLTIPEIQEAFKMFVAKEFSEIKVFRILDCVVVGEVLNAFIDFRNENLRIYEQKKQVIMIEQENKITPSEEFEIMSNAINKKYSEYLETKDIKEPFSHIFKELIERSIIKMPTKETPKLSLYYDNKIKQASEQLIYELKNTSEPDKHKRKEIKEILESIINQDDNLEAKTKIEMRAKKLVLIDFFNNQKQLNKKIIINE